MYKLLLTLALTVLAGCGDDPEPKNPNVNRPEPASQRKKTAAELDVPIVYFKEPGRKIRVVKQFEFGWTNSDYRGQGFHKGKKLGANEKTGDGRGCAIIQPLTTSDMGPIHVQNLMNVQPITREAIGDEIADDFRFAGIKFDFSVVGSGILYCFRHESLGPVTMQDFRDHLYGYVDLSE